MTKLRKIAVEIVHSSIYGSLDSDTAVKSILGKLRPSPSRAVFLRQLTRGAVLRAGTLDCVINAYSRMNFANIEPKVLSALRTGVYELVFMQEEAPLAAISEIADWVECWNPRACSFVRGVLHAILRGIDSKRSAKPKNPNLSKTIQAGDKLWVVFDRNIFPDQSKKRREFLAAVYSMPEWLVSKMLDEFGEKTEGILKGLFEKPDIHLYPNLLKNSPQELVEILHQQGLSTEISSKGDSLIPRTGKNLENFSAYALGRYLPCDEMSLMAVRFLKIMPGERICVIGDEPRLAVLVSMSALPEGAVLYCTSNGEASRRALAQKKRLGIDNLRITVLDVANAAEVIESSFDRVLAVPSNSGAGDFGRNPQARWKLEDKNQQIVLENEEQLLQSAVDLCAAGGIVIYVTRTMFHEENEEVAETVSNRFQHLQLVDSEIFLPGTVTKQGGFLARIAKMCII